VALGVDQAVGALDAQTGINGLELGDYGAPAPDVPGPLRHAWASGFLESFDGSIDHHLTVSADLERRRWLAQLRTLFPWLERVRLEIAERVVELSETSGIYSDEIRTFELGELKSWLYDNRLRMGRQDYEILKLTHNARNRLAHLDAVSSDDISMMRSAAHAARIRARID